MASEELPEYEDIVRMVEQGTGANPDDRRVLNAVEGIETTFTVLTREMSMVDARKIFTPKLRTLYQMFCNNVHRSKELAVKIATYGLRFESIILPLCMNIEYTVDQRKAKLEEFIRDATIFQTETVATTEQFIKLKADFSKFISTFSGWTKEKVDEDTVTLQALKTLEELRNGIIVIGILAGVIIIVPAFSLPFSLIPWVTGVTCIGNSFMLWKKFFIWKSIKEGLDHNQATIDGLTRSIDQIKKACALADSLSENNPEIMNNNISVLLVLWSSVHDNAVKVKTWLEGSVKDADMPEVMKISLDKSVKIYKEMASCLYKYAEEISLAGIPLPELTM